LIDIAENLLEHLCLVQDRDLVLVIPVSARVDESVHVEVEVVDGRDGRGGSQSMIEDVGILVRQPAEHLGDAEEGC
jgi:hypothetical protein